MDKDRVLTRLFHDAKSEPLNDQVPTGFERRVMACIYRFPQADRWTLWASALWRVAVPCTGLMVILGAWMLYNNFLTAPKSLTHDLDETVLSAVTLPGENSW
jgi:hypothetical protein